MRDQKKVQGKREDAMLQKLITCLSKAEDMKVRAKSPNKGQSALSQIARSRSSIGSTKNKDAVPNGFKLASQQSNCGLDVVKQMLQKKARKQAGGCRSSSFIDVT